MANANRVGPRYLSTPMKFLVAIHHPDGYDGSKEPASMGQAIDDLNDEMVAAGARVFVGGLHPAENAKSLSLSAAGEVELREGPYLPTMEHVGGFWVLECDSLDEALVWGKKAVKACRANVEVRQFH